MKDQIKTVRAVDLRPTDVVVYDDGSMHTVKTVGYGNSTRDGFHEYQGRVSVALVIEFEDGRKQGTHPNMPVGIAT